MKFVSTFACVVAIAVWSCSNDSENLLPRCETVRSLQVTDSGGRVLWRIEAVKPRDICEIRYGQTPAQFAQITPSVGLPRGFASNERLTVECIMVDGWVRSDCSAVTKQTMTCAGYIAGPLPRER